MKTKSKARAPAKRRYGQKDALELLTEDHKLVQGIFKKYKALVKQSGSSKQKLALVDEACDALAIHAQIEENIFYPALVGVIEQEILAEAFVEHDGAKELIEQLQDMEPDDPLFDAKFIVLGEQVKHHIEEEETKIFPKLRRAGIDLYELGAEMKEMKESLEEEPSFPDRPIPREEVPAYIQ